MGRLSPSAGLPQHPLVALVEVTTLWVRIPGAEIWICAREKSWLCGFNNQMLSFLTIKTYTSGIILNKIAGVADYVYV